MVNIGPGQLIIRPYSANISHNTQWFGKMDPYIEFEFEGQSRKTQVCEQGGTKPVWTGTVTFNRIRDFLLNIKLWDHEKFKAHDLIASNEINIQNILQQGHVETELELLHDGKTGAKLKIGFEFKPAMNTSKDAGLTSMMDSRRHQTQPHPQFQQQGVYNQPSMANPSYQGSPMQQGNAGYQGIPGYQGNQMYQPNQNGFGNSAPMFNYPSQNGFNAPPKFAAINNPYVSMQNQNYNQNQSQNHIQSHNANQNQNHNQIQTQSQSQNNYQTPQQSMMKTNQSYSNHTHSNDPFLQSTMVSSQMRQPPAQTPQLQQPAQQQAVQIQPEQQQSSKQQGRPQQPKKLTAEEMDRMLQGDD